MNDSAIPNAPARPALKKEPVPLMARLIVGLLLLADIVVTICFYYFGYFKDLQAYCSGLAQKSDLVAFAADLAPKLTMVVSLGIPITLAMTAYHFGRGEIQTIEEVD